MENSYEELFKKVKDITERIQMLSWALQQNLIDTYVNFNVTRSLEQLNYYNRKSNIDADYIQFNEKIKEMQNIQHVGGEFDKQCNEIEKLYITFKDLCVAVEGKKILDRADHEFERFNYGEAILITKELKNRIARANFDGKLDKVLENLTDQVETQLALYIAHLSSEWEEIFTWSEMKGLNFLTYSLSVQQSDPILLQKILKTLFVTDRINEELKLFSHFFLDHLLENVIHHNCDIFTEDHIGAVVFIIKIDKKSLAKPSYQTIFNNLTAIFEFLYSTLGTQFEGEQSFMEVFSNLIKQKFFNKIIENCIRNNLPSCDSSFVQYKSIVVELEAFNKFLIDLKFIHENESPINKYIDDTECVLYNKKCDKLLFDVRNLLTESLSHGTFVVGTDINRINESIIDASEKEELWNIEKPIFLSKCLISQNVKKILTLIVEHLEESSRLPEKYNQKLVTYIKDIAVMYQCIVPQKFKVNLEACPSDVAVFFNNCFYLAHGLLGPPWCNTLPRPLADHVNLVLLDSIQDLRVLGLEKMSLYLQSQKSNIIQSIENNDCAPWTQDTYEQLDCAINKNLSQMRDLKSSWLHVLPARMYELSMCTLIQILVQAILERVFANTKPIAEELVYMLAGKLEKILIEIGELFEDSIQLENKVNDWSKFTKLPHLLKAQLLEISDLWNKQRDKFQSYTCEEFRQIIKIRFPDDKYRLMILKEIQ